MVTVSTHRGRCLPVYRQMSETGERGRMPCRCESVKGIKDCEVQGNIVDFGKSAQRFSTTALHLLETH